MSIDHLNAAFNCNKFTGNAKLLLVALANRASNGKGKCKFPYGWCFPGISRLMMDIGAKSRDTVIDNLRLLEKNSAIRRERRMGHSSKTFVDIKVLKSWAYSDNDKQEFERKAIPKRKEEMPPVEDEEWEFLLHSDVGNIPTSDVEELPVRNVGETPTTSVGSFPTDNQNVESKQPKESSVSSSDSESESADAESDAATDEEEEEELRNLIHDGVFKQGSAVLNRGKDLVTPDERMVRFSPVQRVTAPTARSTPSSAAPLPHLPKLSPEESEEYKNVIYLSSLWWATHQPERAEESASPDWSKHPWGHPRNWTSEQRREAFWKREGDLEDDNQPEPDFDPDPDPRIKAEALSKDEETMFALYRDYGRERIEKVLRWLPASEYWFRNPDRKLTSLGKLRIKKIWELVSGDCDKYYGRAAETGTEADCEEYVAKIFSAVGGDDAEDLYSERLDPVDPADAAEEEAIYYYDDLELVNSA